MFEFFKKFKVRLPKRNERLREQPPITSTKLTSKELKMSKSDSTKKETEDKELYDVSQLQYEMFPFPKAHPVTRDSMPLMEHQVFSLSNQPVLEIIKYEHKGNKIELKPSIHGLPTINDKDILIYIGSHISYAINSGIVPDKWVSFDVRDYYKFTGKKVGSVSFIRFKEAIERLYGAYFWTNIEVDGYRRDKPFRVLEDVDIIQETRSKKGITKVAIKLPDWLYKTYITGEMLNIADGYFELTPTRKAMYGHIRKHCGSNQGKYVVGIEKFNKKIGKGDKNPKYIRAEIRKIIKNDKGELLNYKIKLDDKTGNLIVYPLNSKGTAVEFKDLVKLMNPDYKGKTKGVSKEHIKALEEAEEMYHKAIRKGMSEETAQGLKYARMRCALE